MRPLSFPSRYRQNYISVLRNCTTDVFPLDSISRILVEDLLMESLSSPSRYRQTRFRTARPHDRYLSPRHDS